MSLFFSCLVCDESHESPISSSSIFSNCSHISSENLGFFLITLNLLLLTSLAPTPKRHLTRSIVREYSLMKLFKFNLDLNPSVNELCPSDRSVIPLSASSFPSIRVKAQF